MSYPGGWRPHLESALCLDIADLLRAHAVGPNLHAAATLRFGTRASAGARIDTADAAGTLTLDYTANGTPETCRIELVTVRCGFGGRRWLFVCPASGRRARKLYKWANIPLFRHRDAVRPRPTYASQRDGGADRIMRQRWAIRRKLRDDFTDLFDEPMKPKRMRWRTFERYAARDAELASREGVYWSRLPGRLGVVAPDDAATLAAQYGA